MKLVLPQRSVNLSVVGPHRYRTANRARFEPAKVKGRASPQLQFDITET